MIRFICSIFRSLYSLCGLFAGAFQPRPTDLSRWLDTDLTTYLGPENDMIALRGDYKRISADLYHATEAAKAKAQKSVRIGVESGR